jgi:hypothetical protein
MGPNTVLLAVVMALVAGAGPAAVFSPALVGLSTGNAAVRVAAGVCFLIVAGGVVLGLHVMLAK